MFKYNKLLFLLITSFIALNLRASSHKRHGQGNYLVLGDGHHHSASKIDLTQPFYKITTDALNLGIGQGIIDTTTDAVSSSLSFVPGLVKRFGLITAGIISKIVFGSRGLSPDLLILNKNEIKSLIAPYTKKQQINTDRVKRMTDIAQDVNNDELRDPDWERMQDKILTTLNSFIIYLTNALPCYNIRYANPSFIRRFLAGTVQVFSSQDNDQICRAIISARNDIEDLKNIILRPRSLREVDQNTNLISTWSAIVLNDIEKLNILIRGDTVNPDTNIRPNFAGPASQNDILAALTGA